MKPLLSIIIPCYNEESGIASLKKKLMPVLAAVRKRYQIQLVFVDDGSTDQTNDVLHANFGKLPGTLICRHARNRNIGAAIRTGIRHATGELVAMMDSDCTYNPHTLMELLDLLEHSKGVGKGAGKTIYDFVTVSPYHPKGKMLNGLGCRLWLSRLTSRIYSLIMGRKIYTVTALNRVYRMEVLQRVRFNANGFLAPAEILCRAVLRGYRVGELPAVLGIRKHGDSKMKLLRAIGSHALFMMKLLLARLTGMRGPDRL